jgi:hypothetical protein
MRRLACVGSLAVGAIALVGCGNPPPAAPDGGTAASSHVVFEPGEGPIDFADVPFPDDLYLQDGHVEIGELPSSDDAMPEMLEAERTAFRDLDGFGVTSPVFFRIDGDLDPASLPASPAASLRDDASVFFVDADGGSPAAFDRIPVEVRWDAATRLLAVRPWNGHALHEGRAYAAVVTSSVRATDGTALAAAPRFAEIRDASSRPDDPTDAEAWNEYSQVLASLTVPTATVAGLAVFHVQTASTDMSDARELVRAAAPTLTFARVLTGTAIDDVLGMPEMPLLGTDVAGGVVHSHIGTLVDGTFEAPYLLSEQRFVHGPWQRDSAGALVVRRMDTVWFTVALPEGDTTNLPVVVFQHGIGSNRGAMFAVADALCAQGFAVAAIDIPWHGMRADGASVDTRHAFGSATGPDLYGDVGGTAVYVGFVGVVDAAGPYVPFHASYPRDALRQSALDISALVNALDTADWSAVGTMGGPADLGFASDPMGFVGVSLGGIIGTTFVASEPRIGAAVLNVTGGELTNLVAYSASFNQTFLPLLLPSLGLEASTIDYANDPPRFFPELAIYQTLLDRGDSMTFAPILATQPKDVLFQMAFDDETLPNVATEALARAAGASIVGGMPRYTDLAMVEPPLVSNLVLGSARVTRGLTVFDPATHGLLSQRSSEASVEHPPQPPFVTVTPAVAVANPVDEAVGQLVHFFVTFRSGAAEIAE